MHRVLLHMQNFLFGDAIARALRREETDFEVMEAESPEQVVEIGRWFLPHVLLMEVNSYSPCTLAERLDLCERLKQLNSHCKTVLIVDEKAEKKLARKVLQAKKDGVIDNFIYSSISSSYLSAVIDAL